MTIWISPNKYIQVTTGLGHDPFNENWPSWVAEKWAAVITKARTSFCVETTDNRSLADFFRIVNTIYGIALNLNKFNLFW
jgi:hypothetical protein